MKLRTTVITQEIVVSASPDEIYNAFVDAKKHAAFTGSKATSNPVIGGEFTAWDGYITGKYLELQKDHRIVQEWITSEWPPGYPPSKLELTFQEVKGGTEITMKHSDVPAEQAEDYRKGWIDNYWDLLKTYFVNKRSKVKPQLPK